MSIEAITALNAVFQTQQSALSAATGADDSGFANVLDALEGLNQQIRTNEGAVQELALGETDNLHQVMMNLERTRLTFDLMMQVRNKLLEGYQELMRMQV